MTIGPNEELIREGYRQDGIELPESIANRPELLPGQQLYWDAFANLKRGLGTQSIPYRDLVWYCDYYGIVGDQRDRLIEAVKFMDETYNEIAVEQMNAQRTAGK